MMRRALLALTLFATAALVADAARADVLVLKDGRILEREKMERDPKGVKVHFENGVVLVPHAEIQDALLAKPPEPKDLSAEDQANLAKGLVPFEGKWVKPAKREALLAKKLAARREAVEKLKHHSLWRNRHKEETKHFKFEYTVAPFVYEYYEATMEAYYKAFAKTWKIKQPKDLGKLKVCFYTNREMFAQIGGAAGALGYFRFVQPLELNFFYSRVDPDQTEQVMYHEASHYLQKLINPDFSMPHFPGEAIAEYYGASKFDPKTKKLATGLILEGRLTEVKTDIAAGDVWGLEKLLLGPRGTYEHYTWGWTLAHYLMNHSKYAKKFQKFVKGLPFDKKVKRIAGVGNLKTVAPAEVYRYFRACLGLKKDEDVKRLEAEWHEYINHRLKLDSARGLELAARAAKRDGRRIRAKRLFKEAIAAGSSNPLTFYHYGDVLEDDGKTDEAIKMFRKAIELGPLEPEFYAALGRVLYRKGDKEEGLRAMKLSLELDPDNFWLADTIKRYQKEASGD